MGLSRAMNERLVHPALVAALLLSVLLGCGTGEYEKRLNALTDAFLRERLDIRWQCLARVDRVTPSILGKMYEAGCREIHYGVESGNLDILAATAKHIKLDQVKEDDRLCGQPAAERGDVLVGHAFSGHANVGRPGAAATRYRVHN